MALVTESTINVAKTMNVFVAVFFMIPLIFGRCYDTFRTSLARNSCILRLA